MVKQVWVFKAFSEHTLKYVKMCDSSREMSVEEGVKIYNFDRIFEISVHLKMSGGEFKLILEPPLALLSLNC